MEPTLSKIEIIETGRQTDTSFVSRTNDRLVFFEWLYRGRTVTAFTI